jgi:hypothetical protein
MAQRKGDQIVGSQLAGLVVPYSQEFRDLGVDETFLREISELTGGGPVARPRDVFLQNRRKSRLSLDLWPWLLGAAAVLLVPEIGLRRVGTGFLSRITTRFRSTRSGQGGSGHDSSRSG